MIRRPVALTQALLLAAALLATGGASPAAADTYPRPLGTLTALAETDPTCATKAPGHTCAVYRAAACPGIVGTRKLFIATRRPPPEVATRGVVVLFSGGTGQHYWLSEAERSRAWVDNVVNAGMISVQVRYHNKWFTAKPGELVGPGAMSCFPATVVDWLYETLYAPLGLDPAVGRCGFCLVGSSIGSSVPAYLIEHFGMEATVDAVFTAGGPLHAALLDGCVVQNGFNYGKSAIPWVDPTYGYATGSGPCYKHNQNAAWRTRWTEDGIDSAGDHGHPETRVHILIGERDTLLRRAQRWQSVLVAAGTPDVTLTSVAGMGHQIKDSQAGMDALQASVLLT